MTKTHDVCMKWVWTHDATFALKKYELTHFTRNSRKFNMTASIQIKSSVIKSKSNVRVLKIQLNMKLQWDAHLRQIEASHVTRMLALSRLEVFTWETIFTKAKQVYSAVVRSEIAFKASVWHQHDKEKELSGKKCRLETLQNQTLHHVVKAFKRVSIETLEIEMYISSLHVHLNMLQNKVTLRSWVNDKTQETKQACKLICVRLTKINHLTSHFSVIKKIVLLNTVIQEGTRMQSRRRWFDLSTTISISDSIAIVLYHKDQWKQWWEKYKKCIADVNVTSAQRSHLFNKMIKMHDDLQKIKSILATYIRIERIDLNVYLHLRNVLSTNSSRCNCEWSHQTAKHVLMHCSNWTHLQLRMLRNIDFLNYQIIVTITKDLRAAARIMMKTKLLKQFKVTRTLIL